VREILKGALRLRYAQAFLFLSKHFSFQRNSAPRQDFARSVGHDRVMAFPTAVRRGMRHMCIAASLATAACAGQIRPALTPTSRSEALLILPGFGYGRGAEQTLRALAPAAAAEGLDLYVPSYISRWGLDRSREHLSDFIREQRLERYHRLHVFAFIAGGWSFNPLAETPGLPNLATVVYDRSPLQERAARIATDHLHFLTWIRYGTPVFDVARTPYPTLATPSVRIALLVETRPTTFVSRRAAAARKYGPFDFDCDSFRQPHDDCAFVALNHDQMYQRFSDILPEVLAFIRTGRFSSAAVRQPPAIDPLADEEAR
jgi:hypothetical protein